MIDLKKYNEVDPLKRLVEKESGGEEFSPMDPPDAFNSAGLESIDQEAYHPFLKSMVNRHKDYQAKVSEFEKAIIFIKENGLQKDESVKEAINEFFAYMDQNILPHNRNQDKILFPLLSERLKEKSKHGHPDVPSSAIDIVEDDHSKLIQLSTLSFNLLGLVSRLTDHNSRLVVLDLAFEQNFAMIELLRIHMFREDNIVFNLAQNHLSQDEMDSMMKLGSLL